MLNGTINLTTLEQWLEKQLQTIFNHLANFLAVKSKQNEKKKKIKNYMTVCQYH